MLGPLVAGPQCHMSILRNGNVACLCCSFSPMSHVEFKKRLCNRSLLIFTSYVACHYALCRMLNLRNAHVALLILGVKGHSVEGCISLGRL